MDSQTFKVGDRVRIKKHMKVNTGGSFIEDMVQYKGRIFTIKNISLSSNRFYMKERGCDRFYWKKEWLSLVKKFKPKPNDLIRLEDNDV